MSNTHAKNLTTLAQWLAGEFENQTQALENLPGLLTSVFGIAPYPSRLRGISLCLPNKPWFEPQPALSATQLGAKAR